MYHLKTDEHNKEVIMGKLDGVVRVVFATMALGMGVNFSGLTCTTGVPVLWTTTSKRVAEEVSSQCRQSTGRLQMFLCGKISVISGTLKGEEVFGEPSGSLKIPVAALL